MCDLLTFDSENVPVDVSSWSRMVCLPPAPGLMSCFFGFFLSVLLPFIMLASCSYLPRAQVLHFFSGFALHLVFLLFVCYPSCSSLSVSLCAYIYISLSMSLSKSLSFSLSISISLYISLSSDSFSLTCLTTSIVRSFTHLWEQAIICPGSLSKVSSTPRLRMRNIQLA